MGAGGGIDSVYTPAQTAVENYLPHEKAIELFHATLIGSTASTFQRSVIALDDTKIDPVQHTRPEAGFRHYSGLGAGQCLH